MAMATNVPRLNYYVPATDGSELTHLTWPLWLEQFGYFLDSQNITGAGAERRKIGFLYSVGGPHLLMTYKSHRPPVTDPPTVETYESIVTVLTRVFAQTRHSLQDEIAFREMAQKPDESANNYMMRLKAAAVTVTFLDDGENLADRNILIQYVIGIKNDKVREALARENNLTLTTAISITNAIDRAQPKPGEPATAKEPVVQFVGFQKQEWNRGGYRGGNRWVGLDHGSRPYSRPGRGGHGSGGTCFGCGMERHADRADCMAYNKECRRCRKRGHFERVCQAGRRGGHQARRVSESDIPEREETGEEAEREFQELEGYYDTNYLDILEVTAAGKRRPETTVEIGGKYIDVVIDSGADVSVFGKQAYFTLGRPTLFKPKKLLRAFGSEKPLTVLGVARLSMCRKDKTRSAEIYFVDGRTVNLLGCQDALSLGAMTLDVNFTQAIGESKFCKEFPKVFTGLGCFKGKAIALQVDKTVEPSAVLNRRIPIHLRSKVDEEIQRLLKLDIIEEVHGPSRWVSPVVIVPKKDGRLRVCVDCRRPNVAILRKRVMMPVIDDLLVAFNGCKWFSKIDLQDGYHQFVLEEEARELTTFATHRGLYRYKRLNFGVNAAAELFQEAVEGVLPRSLGVANILDDILIGGATIQEHDKRVRAVLERLQTAGLTANGMKCDFSKQEVKFFGHFFGVNGVRVDPARVVQISDLPAPQDVGQLRSLLGMVGYCARFVPNLSGMVEPLRAGAKTKERFTWSEEMEKAWSAVKRKLVEAPTLGFFDASLPTEVITDAGPAAVGGILVQVDKQGRPLVRAYYSRRLSETEKKYAQIDKEMVGITSAILHFQVYLLGKDFTVKTDHRPLVQMLNKVTVDLPARIQRLQLKLQEFEFAVKHISGVENPSDYLSRHPIGNLVAEEEEEADYGIREVVTANLPVRWTREGVLEAISVDRELNKVRKIILRERDPEIMMKKDNDTKQFLPILREITVTEEGFLLKGERIIVPRGLQKEVVKLAHAGHQGMTRTKSILRSKVWFRGMDEMVESCIKNCVACAVVTKQQIKLPVSFTVRPPGPWQWWSMDYSKIEEGDYLLVVEDIFSKFPVVARTKSTDFETCRRFLEEVVALFGLPQRIFSDNGPPFNGAEFASWLRVRDVEHRKSIPAWPQSNGQVERFMASLNKVVRIAKFEGKDLNNELRTFLAMFRTTTHATTGKTPGEVTFSFQPRSRLMLAGCGSGKSSEQTTDWSERTKKMESNTNENRSWKKAPEFKTGERVFIPHINRTKQMPFYDPAPWTVTAVQGQRLSLEREGKTCQRNIQAVKKVLSSMTLGERGKGDSCGYIPSQARDSRRQEEGVIVREQKEGTIRKDYFKETEWRSRIPPGAEEQPETEIQRREVPVRENRGVLPKRYEC